MARANRLIKPSPHECCPNASHLRPRSLSGAWRWVLHVAGVTLPVICCPWCGAKLPLRSERARLGVVRGDG